MKKSRLALVFLIVLISLGLVSVTLASAGFARSPAVHFAQVSPMDPPASPQGEGPWVVRAYFSDPAMVASLATWTEPWEVNTKENYVVLEVTRLEYSLLQNAGFGVEVDQKLTDLYNTPNTSLPGQVNGIPGYPCYRTVEETFATAQNLVAAYPHLASWIDIGDSWEKVTPNGNPGYDMLVLRLTNDAVPGPKPKLFIMSSIHAREYAPAELNTRFAEFLLQNYNLDPDVTWLLDYQEIHLLLQSNPDGRKYAEGGAYWRKNTNQNYCGPTSSSRGADLNRNFEFYWNHGGSSSNECDEVYRGPSAASEPEVQAVQNYVRAIFPDQRGDPPTDPAPQDATGVFMDLHSYSELVLWSWGFTATVPSNGTDLQTLGRKFAYYNSYYPEQSIGLYPTSGTTDDFAYGELGVAAYTFEMGTAFFQSCSTFNNTIVPANMPALVYAAKASRAPYMNPAGPDALNPAAAPAAGVPGGLIHLGATIDDTRFNNSNGTEPTQVISGAEFYIDTPPWITTTAPIAYPMTPADGAYNSPVEAVEADLDTSGLSLGRHTIFIRGQDAAGNWGVVSAAFIYIIDPQVAPRIEGFVRDALTNAPVAGQVNAGNFQAITDPGTGFYQMIVVSGTYDLDASAAGYSPASASGIQVQDYQTARQNFYLDPVCTIFSDDVESGNQGWTAQIPWAITTEAAHSPSHSWTDSPGGNYGNNRNISLTSPALDLSSYQGVALNFWHTYALESSYDYGYVEYSTNGGLSWTNAATYNGIQNSWTQTSVSLPALDHQPNARIRFRFYSDSSVTFDGWHIDDIQLNASGSSCASPAAPAAEFTSNSPVLPGQAVQFIDMSSGTTPLTYHWDFGDNSGVSNLAFPSYIYNNPGVYTVSMAVTNTLGSDSIHHAVVVTDGLCIAPSSVYLALVANGPFLVGTPVDFSADLLPDWASKPYTYTIDFGDGLTNTGQSSTDPFGFSHIFTSSGNPLIQIGIENCGTLSPITDAIQIQVVDIITPLTQISLTLETSGVLYAGDVAAFTADLLPDDATKPYQYYLNFGDGSPVLTGTQAQDPWLFTHTYASQGVFPLTAAAWNVAMTTPITASLQVTVSLREICTPLSGISIQGPDRGPRGIYTFTAVYSPATATLPLSITWDNGDNGPVSVRDLTPGVYTLTASASNCALPPTSAAHAITVYQPPTRLPLILGGSATVPAGTAHPESGSVLSGIGMLAVPLFFMAGSRKN